MLTAVQPETPEFSNPEGRSRSGPHSPKRALDPVGLHAALMVKHVGVRHEDRLLASLRVASSKMTLA